MQPGNLRTYALLQVMETTDDPYGQPVQSWRDLGVVMVWDRVPTARDLSNNDMLTQIRNHLVVMRWDPRVVPTCRLVVGDRVLRIVEILPADQKSWEMNVVCVEQRDEDPAGDVEPEDGYQP